MKARYQVNVTHPDGFAVKDNATGATIRVYKSFDAALNRARKLNGMVAR